MSATQTAVIEPLHEPQPLRAGVPFTDTPQTKPRLHYQPLVIVLVAVCVGMIANRFGLFPLPQNFLAWWCLAAVALGAWLVASQTDRQMPALIALLISLAALGGAWHHLRWHLFDADEIGRFATETPEPVGLEAIVVSAPQFVPAPPPDPLRSVPLSPQTRLAVRVVEIRDGTQWHAASGRARMIVNGQLQDVQLGDRLRIFGQLMTPTPAANPGEFDFALHARGDRELSMIRVEHPACVSVVASGSKWNPARWFHAIRRYGDEMLWSHLSADRAGLAAALLLGQREQVDRQTNEAFLETGTIHVLSISGLHVGILAWLLFLGLHTGWMSRRLALACVIAITGAYMLLTLAEPPVVRATLLVWIVCGGIWLGRRSLNLNSLALAALVVLVINPIDLFRTGVQLSFLSAAVLMWLGQKFIDRPQADPLDRLIAATRPWPQRAARRVLRGAAELFVIGAILWVIITPLTMARFHLISPSGLILNVLLAPVVAVAMVAGFGVLAFGAWLSPLAAVFGAVCNLSMNVLDRVVKWAAHWPGSHFWVAGPSEVWLAVFYLAVALVVLVPHWLPPPRWRMALLGGWCGLGLMIALPTGSLTSNGVLRCTFVAVGHGGATLVELPDGKKLLYDAGRLGSPAGATRSISACLWSQGISHLDCIVVSHADTDHYNALPELLERFSVGVVYVSPVMFQNEIEALKLLRQSIEDSGTRLEYLSAGDSLHADDNVSIDVLHPPPKGMPGRDNANSIVLAIQCAGRRILLTGDLEPPGLQAVLNEDPCHYDVLLAPHHGSAASDPAAVAAWSTPQWVVIAGSSMDGRAARPIYEANGATVLNTADCGAITVAIDAGSLNVQSFRSPSARANR